MSKRKLRAIVTAGSTVIKRDEVRVFEMLPYVSGEHIPTLFKGIHVELRNIFRGKLGAFIVNELASRDVETTLITRKDLLKPALKNSRLNYTVKEFYTFEDLYETLQSSVAEVKPDIILMAAAVSDYTKKPESGKISSDLDEYSVTFTRTPKILDNLRRWSGDKTLICGFKLLVGVPEDHLLLVARRQIERAETDLCIANDFHNINYESDYHPAILVPKYGDLVHLGGTKKEVASSIVHEVLSRIH